MRPKKPVLYFAAGIVFLLFLYLILFSSKGKIPSLQTSLLKDVSKIALKTEKQAALSGLKKDFVEAGIGKEKYDPGEKIQLACAVAVSNSVVNYWLISKDANGNQGGKYQLNEGDIRALKTESRSTIIELTIPRTVPSGSYIGRIDLLSPGSLGLVGGCATKTFQIENGAAVSVSLGEPTAKEGLIKRVSAKNMLRWEAVSEKNLGLVTPSLVISEVAQTKGFSFKKSYPAFSLSAGTKKSLGTNLDSFGQSGAFRARLELYDESGILVSVSPEEDLYFGSAPGINGVEEIEITDSHVKGKLLLDDLVSANSLLYVRVVIADEKSAKCGQKDYALSEGWPETITVSYTETKAGCKANEIEVYLKVRGIFDQSLDVFKKRLVLD